MPTKEKILHEHSCDGISVVTWEDGETRVGYARVGPSIGLAEEMMKDVFKRFTVMPLHPLFGMKGVPCPDCGLANLERCEAPRQRVIVQGSAGYELKYLPKYDDKRN